MLRLIQRDDCELCDQAWEILHTAGISNFESIFIEGDQYLEQRYGMSVPVLCLKEAELLWPFTAQQVQEWLQALQ
jgi:hypothetical protein